MPQVERELRILEALEDNPDATQAGLAAQLGVAVGSVNWYLKRLIRKGFVKAKQMERRRLKYFVTPAGLALKARLTKEYMEVSLRVYRELREAAREAVIEIGSRGYGEVAADGSGEAMEIFRLTCLEHGVATSRGGPPSVPTVRTEGTGFAVDWPE
jgi:DNA-binding MarR family transcriptional regulator